MKLNFRRIYDELKSYFNLMADKEDEQEVIEQVSKGVVFRGANLWILIFAIFIASLGLNVNSTAVIIGAMLISPLMGPIIGMGVAIGIADTTLLRRAINNYLVATLISVATATVYFLISPLSDAQSELLARTSPTLYDVLIAFCGGAAGVLALTTKPKGQVIPGVAIATALMPPLCTAGYGLATAQWSYFLGAFYLFFINTVFIAIATFLGVKLLRFHRSGDRSVEQVRRARRIIAVVVVLAMVPATIMTVKIIRKNVANRNMKNFVTAELRYDGVRILSYEKQGDTLLVAALGREIEDSAIATAQDRMQFYGMAGHTLKVIQGSYSESAAHMAELNRRDHENSAYRKALMLQYDSVESQLRAYQRLESLSLAVSDEAALLFPEVSAIALGQMGHGPVAIVSLAKNRHLNREKSDKLHEWLVRRTECDSLSVVYDR